MTEPTLSSQLLGLVAIFIVVFILLLLTDKNEKSDEQNVVVIIEKTEDFGEVARRNLKNSDRRFTYDNQPPVGLASSIEDVPQVFRSCIEDYDRLAQDYQEEARNNDLLRKQNTDLLEENGRLLYKEMTMDFRRNNRKWGARV
jgi:gp18